MPLIWILWGGPQSLKKIEIDIGGAAPQDLKNCNARKKMREHTIKKNHKETFY